MRKFFAGGLALLISVMFLTPQAAAATYSPPFDPSAKAVYLMNLDSERVIYEKNAQNPIQPGNLAQLMTVILALEKVADPANETAELKSYIQNEMYEQNLKYKGICLAGLLKGDKLSIEKLLYAIMMRSANEAAMMVADYVGDGSVPYFVEMMNRRAQELGAVNTHFTSPHGLPDDQSSTTAYDMVLIARHALSLPDFLQYTEPTTYDGGPIARITNLFWPSRNQLRISTSEFYNRAVLGIKDSFISNAGLGSSVLSLAKKDGYTYLLAVMGATPADASGAESTAAFYETNRLYAWAFDTFRVKTLLEKGKSFEEVKLKLCWGKDFLRLMSADSYTALIPDEIEMSSVKYELVLPNYVKAPIAKGDVVGEVKLVLADEVIGRVGVVSAETVEVSRLLLMVDKLISITRTFWFKFILIFLVVVSVLYLALMVVNNRNRRRYQGRGKRRR